MKPSIPAIALALASAFASFAQAQEAATLKFADKPAQLTIVDLKRGDDGATITLHAVAKNTSSQPLDLGLAQDIYLVDYKNRRRYNVIMSSSLQCLCAPTASVAVPADGVTQIWAKFAAPPDAVTTLSVGWGSLEPVAVAVTK